MPELTPPNLDYLGFPHQVLAQNVSDVDPGVVGEYAAVWAELTGALREFGDDLHAAMSRESASWRGPAAEAVFEFGRRVADFAEDTGEQDLKSAESTMISAEAGGRARSSMPEPVVFDREAEFAEASLKMAFGNPSEGMARMEALDAKQAAAEEAHREAARVSTTHSESLYDAHRKGFEFGAPPTLSAASEVGDEAGTQVGDSRVNAPAVGPGHQGTQAASAVSAPPGTSGVPHVGSNAHSGVGAPAPGSTSGVGQTPVQAPPGQGVSPGQVPRGGSGLGGVVPPVTGAARGGDALRSNKSPFAASGGRAAAGGGAAPRPGQNLAGQRLTSGPGGNSPGAGRSTGAVPPKVDMGAKAAAGAPGAAGRAGASGMAPGAAGVRGKGEEDKEHKNKYALPESVLGEDPLIDDTAGAAIDPESGMTVPRPVIGEGPPTPAQNTDQPKSKPATQANPYV